MRTSARVAATLLTTALAVAGTAAAASADTDTVKDKASDVLSFADQTTDENGTQLGYADSVASGVDLRSMRVKHTKQSVAIKATFSNLAKTTIITASVRVDGKAKPSRLVFNTGRKKATVINARDEERCTVPVTHKYGRGGSVNFVVKRSCLGDPRRVKVAVSAIDAGIATDNGSFKADAVSPKNVRGSSYTSWLKAS
jgi:hypothetical protein